MQMILSQSRVPLYSSATESSRTGTVTWLTTSDTPQLNWSQVLPQPAMFTSSPTAGSLWARAMESISAVKVSGESRYRMATSPERVKEFQSGCSMCEVEMTICWEGSLTVWSWAPVMMVFSLKMFPPHTYSESMSRKTRWG